MVAPPRPASTKTYLRTKWIFVPDGAYDPEAPSLALLSATPALDVTNMFFASSAKPGQSTNLARSPKRVGDAESYEFIGETQPTLGEIRYSDNPQAEPLSADIIAYETFPVGTTGHLVARRGLDRNTDLALTDKVTSYPCECGPQLEVDEGENEGAEAAIAQTFAQTGPKVARKAIVA